MTEEVLNVRGLTGVDLTLRIAGPGTRSYAFLIDWQIRLLGALAWLLIALLLRRVPALSSAAAARDVMRAGWALALLTYFLYHPVLEVLMHGSTPGKRKAGARIVTLEGATPGTGALLIRNVFRLIDCLPLVYLVGLVSCIVTARRVRLGDLAAGTVLVLDERFAGESLARLGEQIERTGLSAEALQLIRDLLDRWEGLSDARRTRLAEELLAKLEPQPPAGAAAPGGAVLRGRLEALLERRARS